MPEKPAQQVPRVWRDQYEKGRAAIDRHNLDYAIQILTQVLEKEPAFYECREALRAAQFKRAGSGGGGFFKKILGSTNPKLVQAQMTARHHPLEALNLAEQALNNDPTNVGAHKVLAEAAVAADLPRTAVLSLEIALKYSEHDKDVAVRLAKALVLTGQAARAETILSELSQEHPNDTELTQLLKDMSASRTLDEGGYNKLADGTGSYRDVLKDEAESVMLEQEQREHKTEDVTARLLGEYQARLASEPNNQRLLRAIAELHTDRKEFDAALECYQRLASGEMADSSLERAIAETRVKKLDHLIEQLDPAAPDYAEQAERLKTERREFLLTDCRQRVDHYPNDLQLRFELGQLYLEAGRVSEAIQEFQKAQNNPHKRVLALYYLAECFARRGIYDLAARTLQNAIREKTLFDDEKKELLYSLGCIFEKMSKPAEAIEQFKLIYEVDIAYKDVGPKVDAYYASQSGG